MNILSIFITGLFAGGLTCLAVQGGLLASSLAQREENKLADSADKTGQVLPVITFLAARLVAYALLGLLLGAVGSVIQLSLGLRVVLQFGVVIFMVGTALNLLNVHPIFRYFVIQPPKFLSRLVKKQSKSQSMFGPALLGALTVLIPCGATQAMMAHAMTTGSWITGGIAMFVFILGTSPLFFILGYLAKKLATTRNPLFNKLAATAILVIALYNLNGALVLSGSNWTWEKIFNIGSATQEKTTEAVSEATIYITQTGYRTEPSVVNVKGGSTVTLNLINQSGSGCIQAFTIPKFGIQRVVPVGSSTQISFSTPKISGTIPFMCSMGMFQGVINII